MKSISNQQRLFLVESEQLLEIARDIQLKSAAFKGSMKWLKSGEHEYLIRLADHRGNGKSLGRKSPQTEAIYQQFQMGKAALKARIASARDQLSLQSKLNRAAGMGRLPSAVAKILSLAHSKLNSDNFTVIGTHALFAYETLSGVFFKQELLASGDVDLMFDPRKKLSLISTKLNGSGLLGLLKEVDKTYSIMSGSNFRAVNSNGFIVDLIIPIQDIRRPSISLAPDDLIASEVFGLDWLCNAPSVNTFAIAEMGMPIPMKVPDPRAFAIHKTWLSKREDRSPVKKPRDFEQAAMVTQALLQYLPNYALSSKELMYLPKVVVETYQDEMNLNLFPSIDL